MRYSLEILFNRYRRSIFSAAYNICGNAEDANDIVQETFLAYWGTSAEFKDEEHLKAWLLRVAINKARNLKRTFWNRKIDLVDELPGAGGGELPEEGILEEIFKLPEKYRVVIHLFYYEGYSVKEIAKIMEISEGSAKMRLSRGRNMLKNILGEENQDDWS